MKKFLFGILILALAPMVLLAAPDKTQERINYEVFKARTEANIDTLKSIKSQELTKFESELSSHKALIEQINHQIDAFGNNLTIGSTIVTVLLLLTGLFAYKDAKADAKNTAKEVTQTEVKSWFDKNTNDLTQEIERLRQKLKTLEEEASIIAASTTAKIEKHLSDVVSKGVDANTTAITEEEKNALNAKIEELKSISEAMYVFEDWNTKAFAAYHRGDFINAANFWDNASKSLDATDAQKAQSLFNKGVTQGRHIEPKQPEAAIATYDALVARFSSSEHAAVQEQVARAYLNKGVTQRQALNQPEAAIATYDVLIARFSSSEHAAVQEQVARAYFNKGVAQGEHLKQPEAAIATYDALIERFSSSELAAVQEQVARAYLNKGIVQGAHLKQPEAAIAIYDALIERFSSSEHTAVQEQVARAYFSKGAAQWEHLKQPEAAIATYDALIERFSSSEHAAVQEQVANAYLNKGVTQRQALNQPEAAIATYDALIERFSSSEHAAVQEQVANAYNCKGFAYLMNTKQIWKNKAARESQLKTALDCFNKALSLCAANDKGMVLGNTAYANWLLGVKANTEQQLTEALTIGGKALYDATLKDAETHPVAPDKTFKTLLNKVWQTIPQSKSDS